MFSAAQPEVDEEGCYFLCPSCGHRNALINAGGGGSDDTLELAQPDE